MAWILLLILFILFFLGIPIAYALLGAVLCYFGILHRDLSSALLFEQIAEIVQKPSFLSLLLFILSGSVLRYSGVSKRLHRLAETLVGHLSGSLAQVNVLWSMLMGAVSGSANADAAMQSQLLVPEMERCGYSRGFSAAITAASSAVTPIIPPGINLLLYAVLVLPDASVEDMFLAGLLPGVLMTAALMAAVHGIAKKRGYPAGRRKRASGAEIWCALKEAGWGLLYPFGIILGLKSGMFTMPEVAMLALCFSFLVGALCYREWKLRYLLLIFRDTVEAAASVMLIVFAAKLFQLSLSSVGIPEVFSSLVPVLMQNRALALLAVNLFLLVLGMFFEGGAILIVMAPLLFPFFAALGVDPVHFGVICVMNTTIGGLTPPFGSMMLTCCSITGCRMKEFVKESMPLIGILLLVLALITYIPWFSVWGTHLC